MTAAASKDTLQKHAAQNYGVNTADNLTKNAPLLEFFHPAHKKMDNVEGLILKRKILQTLRAVNLIACCLSALLGPNVCYLECDSDQTLRVATMIFLCGIVSITSGVDTWMMAGVQRQLQLQRELDLQQHQWLVAAVNQPVNLVSLSTFAAA